MAGGAESAEKAWQWALPMSSVPLYVQQEEQHYKAHNDQAYCVKRNILILLCMSLFKKNIAKDTTDPRVKVSFTQVTGLGHITISNTNLHQIKFLLQNLAKIANVVQVTI